ncbi:MAG: PIN domain-containing protein [Candidatus Bathyarchaeia archaeon]|nr:PIN domain-containing protein [Candidatus Bathyarchaeota archaeon]
MEGQAGRVVVFDAYAWCEYVVDGPHAETVAQALQSAYQALTPASALAEVREALERHQVEPSVIKDIMEFIRARSQVVNIDVDVAEKAGEVNFQMKKRAKGWGMLDSFVYAVALLKKGWVLTGDTHFRDLANVIYIGE